MSTERFHAHPTTEAEALYDRTILEVRRRIALAALLAAAAALLLALMVTLLVIWLIVSQPKATAFDADGVRCYKAVEMVCIKTAEPAR